MKSSFELITEDMRRRLEMLSSSPVASMAEAVRRQLEAVRSQTAIPEEIRRNLLELSSSPVASMAEAVRRQLEAVSSNLADQADLSRLYETIWNLKPINTFTDFLAAVDEQQFDDVDIRADGSVVIDGETATSAEMHDAIAALLDQPEDFLRDLSDRLASLSKPLRLIVSWFLKNALAVLSIILTLYLDNRTGIQNRELHQQLQQQILQDGDRTRRQVRDAAKALEGVCQDLSQWRVVTNPVNVKAQPATKAAITDRLTRGTVVRRVEKRGRWALVKYESPKTGILVKGWAYSKYLKRIGD